MDESPSISSIEPEVSAVDHLWNLILQDPEAIFVYLSQMEVKKHWFPEEFYQLKSLPLLKAFQENELALTLLLRNPDAANHLYGPQAVSSQPLPQELKNSLLRTGLFEKSSVYNQKQIFQEWLEIYQQGSPEMQIEPVLRSLLSVDTLLQDGTTSMSSTTAPLEAVIANAHGSPDIVEERLMASHTKARYPILGESHGQILGRYMDRWPAKPTTNTSTTYSSKLIKQDSIY